MHTLVLEPTVTAQWYALIQDARKSTSIQLPEELESYLVFLLMRFSEHPELFNSILAIDFLESHAKWGEARKLALRDVGDKCLLYAGLFPGKARKRRVKISYYVALGQSAYNTLSIFQSNNSALLFKHLGQQFVELMDTLHSIRALDTHSAAFSLDLIEAHELWTDTASAYAYKILKAKTNMDPILSIRPNNSLN
jgi:hypothetical protein